MRALFGRLNMGGFRKNSIASSRPKLIIKMGDEMWFGNWKRLKLGGRSPSMHKSCNPPPLHRKLIRVKLEDLLVSLWPIKDLTCIKSNRMENLIIFGKGWWW